MKRSITIILALCLCVALGVTAFAADIDTDGGSGNTPVYLSSTVDGTPGGTPAAMAMSVTLPTSFPMAMSQNGDVTCADSCRIVNHSYGAVRVRSVSISADNGWRITAYGGKDTLAREKVDSNKFGFALRLGGGSLYSTDGASESGETLISSPQTGCYMCGAGDTTGNYLAVYYDAIVTPLSRAVVDANIADVVFVVEWDT